MNIFPWNIQDMRNVYEQTWHTVAANDFPNGERSEITRDTLLSGWKPSSAGWKGAQHNSVMANKTKVALVLLPPCGVYRQLLLVEV